MSYEPAIKVKSLYKAINLLNYFTRENPERRIAELSQLSGLGKSTVHNIMSTFEVSGFVTRNPRTNQYSLGNQIIYLSNCMLFGNDLRKVMRPYMEKICAFTNQNIYFAIPYECVVLYMESVFSKIVNTSKNIIGAKAPMYCTGIGKAMLAFLPDDILEGVKKQGLLNYTPNTITDSQELDAELKKVREQGYAVDNMEHEYGVRCVAVPVKNIRGELIGAISTSGPVNEMSEENIEKTGIYMIKIVEELLPSLSNF